MPITTALHANDERKPAVVAEATSALKWMVLSRSRPSATTGIPAGNESLNWVANNVTLIYGSVDAVLVDTFLLANHTLELADWIQESNKNLKTIYATHGHGDHFFGLGVLQNRFPRTRAVATPGVIEAMRRQLSPDFMATFWVRRFAGQLPEPLTEAIELRDGDLDLEGHTLVPVKLGYTDTIDTTCLHVPSLGLVIAGDAVYDGIHPYLAETTPQTRLEWIAALDAIDALSPRTVIPGHGVPGGDNSPRHVDATRRYLRDFNAASDETRTARQLYDRMLQKYPDRVNPGSLWSAAHAAKP